MRRSAFVLSCLAACLVALGLASPAFGSSSTTIIKWTGAGSENLPCPKGAHWVIAGGTLALDHCNTTATASAGTAGTLFVHDEGVTEPVGLVAVGNSEWSGDNAMALDTSISARAEIEAASPTETPTSPPTSPPGPPLGSPTGPGGVLGRTVTPGGTGPGGLAFTGSSGTGPMLALAGVLVLLGASLLLWTRRTT